MKGIESRLTTIEARNAKVELDKAWETSLVRRLSIAGLTYVTVSVFLVIINKQQPFINALVPAIGYILSTLALRQFRSLWEQKRRS